MFGFGIQIFALVAIALSLLLAAFAAYVRIRANTYTEKRFSFVALWACTSIVSVAFLSVTDVQLFSLAVGLFGIKLEVTTLPEKTLIVLLAVAYCYIVRGWSLSWHGYGLLTEEGKKNKERGKPNSILINGLSETVRILARRPAPKIASQKSADNRQLLLGAPLDELPLHEKVRSLVQVKWPEYEIRDDAWIGEIGCWLGHDRGFNRPIILVCGAEFEKFDFNKLASLREKQIDAKDIRILGVFRFIQSHSNRAIVDSSQFEGCDIQVLSIDELVSTVVNFDDYRRGIEIEFKEKRLPDANFAIAQVLAPTRIQIGLAAPTLGLEARGTDFSEFVISWLQEESSRQLALLGEYGQGKSTAVLALTYSLLFSPELRASCGNRIPILIRLTGRSPSTTRLAELLGAWGAQYNLSGQVLLSLHRAGKLLLIFDAFDEMAHVMDRTARFEHFDALWEFACPDAKIIFTGRPNFFLDDEELKEVLGITKTSAVGPYCEALRVTPFGIEQIETAINWLPLEKRNVLVEAVKRSRSLQEVCCRPSLLYLIAHLWNRGRLDLRSDRVNSADVIREFISYSLERQIEKQREEATARRPERQFLNLTKAELEYFTSGIAVASLTEGRQNSIPKEIFEARINELYERLPNTLPPGKDEVATLALPIKQRFLDLSNPVEACINAVRTHGVIEHDVARSRHYRFSHKSFCEVLAAEMLTSRIIKDDDVSAAIEQANSTSLIDLVDQPQIVQFVADFLAGASSEAGNFTYLDVYKRIFPSSIDSGRITRLRSVMAAILFLATQRPYARVVRMVAYLLMMGALTMYLFSFFARIVDSYPDVVDSTGLFKYFDFRGTYLYYFAVAFLVFGALFFVLFRASFHDFEDHYIAKFNLISRLCDLFEKNKQTMRRTKIEKIAHRLASTRVSGMQ